MKRAVVEAGMVVADNADGVLPVPWWSFTKTVIAAAALALVRDGALVLDVAVRGAPYTLRHLLQHRAGLGDYGELAEYHAAVARGEKPWPAAEMLRRSRADELRYPPGEGWEYSNIGYLKVGELLEAAAGVPLDAVLMRAVLGPLGIHGVTLARRRADLLGIEMGEARGYDPGWVYHGLLVGPLHAAAQVLDGLLTGALLPTKLVRDMRTAHPVGPSIPGRPWVAPGYGLGLMLEMSGEPAGHTGAGPGSVIAVYRQEREGTPVTAAAFALSDDQGAVERAAFEGVRPRCPGSIKGRIALTPAFFDLLPTQELEI